MRLGFFSVMIATVALTTVKATNLNMEWSIAPPETEEAIPALGYAQVGASNEINDL